MSTSEKILFKVLQNVAVENEFNLHILDIKPISSCGANYTSDLFKAEIIDVPTNDRMKVFGKVGVLRGTFRIQLQGDRIFEIERLFYTDLKNKYEELQKKYNVSEKDMLYIPKFYGMNDRYNEETIVLENLFELGYSVHHRKEPVSWEYAQVAVDELAKLHALSFAYKHHCSEDYKEKVPKLEIVLSDAYREFKKCWEKMVVKTFDTVDEDKRARLKKFMENLLHEEKIIKYYGTGKWGQIVHGDYRPSNLLHKVENGKISKIVPIDYQTLRLSSPSTDLLYFIYSSTDKAFRKMYLKQLTDHYYDRLCTYLKNYSLDPTTTFSRSDFDEDYKEMLPYGLSQTIFILPIVMVDEKEAPNIWGKDANLANFSVNTSEEFKVRFNDIVDEFVEMGVI